MFFFVLQVVVEATTGESVKRRGRSVGFPLPLLFIGHASLVTVALGQMRHHPCTAATVPVLFLKSFFVFFFMFMCFI